VRVKIPVDKGVRVKWYIDTHKLSTYARKYLYDTDYVYLAKLQTRGVKKSILYI
jgi:hypothetical protein